MVGLSGLASNPRFPVPDAPVPGLITVRSLQHLVCSRQSAVSSLQAAVCPRFISSLQLQHHRKTIAEKQLLVERG